jgi:hypothetical protein
MGLLDKLLGKKSSYNNFAREMIRTLESLGANDIRHDASAHSLQFGSANNTIYLDNAFSDYVSTPANDRPGVLQRYAASFTQKGDIPSAYATCKSQLLPVVRDPAYYGLTYLMLKAKGADATKLNFVTRDFAPGLSIGIAHDTPASIVTVSASQLTTWQVTPDQAFDNALSNLREKSEQPRFKELGSGLYLGEWGDCYDTSRILVPELFHRLPLNGDPVIFLPNRDTIFVTGAYNTAALGLILKYGTPIHFEQGHSLSPNFYVHADGKWSLFAPEDPAVAREAWAVRYRRQAIDYEQQKQYLEDMYRREKLDVFVASCQLMKRKDDSLFTSCVWGRDVDSLLPETEKILLGLDSKTNDFVAAAWEKAFPTVSRHFERVPDLVPVRYRTKSFPTPEEIQTLRNLGSA